MRMLRIVRTKMTMTVSVVMVVRRRGTKMRMLRIMRTKMTMVVSMVMVVRRRNTGKRAMWSGAGCGRKN